MSWIVSRGGRRSRRRQATVGVAWRKDGARRPGRPRRDEGVIVTAAATAARDQIDALRAAADLLVLVPVQDAWIAVTGGSIQLIPGVGAAGQATAVASIAARLGTTTEISRHHGRTWHTAAGHLGRHQVTVFAALQEQEPSR